MAVVGYTTHSINEEMKKKNGVIYSHFGVLYFIEGASHTLFPITTESIACVCGLKYEREVEWEKCVIFLEFETILLSVVGVASSSCIFSTFILENQDRIFAYILVDSFW